MKPNAWRLRNTENEVIELRVYPATNFFTRLRGLLFRRSLAEREGLWIKPCNAIHTLGMRYAIDVLFLDAQFNVVAIHHAVTARRFKRCGVASSVLEMLGGSAAQLGIVTGSKILIS